jgi:hypothetical protein
MKEAVMMMMAAMTMAMTTMMTIIAIIFKHYPGLI